MHRTLTAVAASITLCFIFSTGVNSAGELPGPGMHKMSLELEDGTSMKIGIHFPKKLKERGKVPLVIALHYGGHGSPYFGVTFSNLLIVPAFKDLGAIIVAPDCPDRRWTTEKSDSAIMQLLDHALENWPVDADRVVLTGYSMGGYGTYYTALRHGERLSAIIPVSAQPQGRGTLNVPLYAVNSRQDGLMQHQPTANLVKYQLSRNVPAELNLVDGPTHYQTSRFVEPLSEAVEWLHRLWEPEAD